MFVSSYGAPQTFVAVILVALQVAALVVLWTDRGRHAVWKAVWTAAIVLLPLVGAGGFFINHGLGRLARRLQHNDAEEPRL